ncbi:MAG: DUF2752 domain-containing protein [Myxococcota bacterium]
MADAATIPAVTAESKDVPVRGTWLSRVVWLFLFAPPAAVFYTAATLTPSLEGHGTHTQLGLPPCGFLVMTGLPCPGCGLTTCFSHMVRGEFLSATAANPFGVMLFLVSTACMVTAFIGMIRALPVLETLDRLKADKWAMLLAASSLTVWLVKVVTLTSGL